MKPAQRTSVRLPDAELTQELIGARLDGLPELPRSVFLLRHMDGLEVAAIGERLGITAEVMEGYLRHAIDVLVWGAP
jgi:DNA-directed RNA polymerase specialized sigma24 family protein